jgi:hypothetical protein
MIVSRPSIALVLTFELALVGCSYVEPRELSALACSDEHDNDGDGLRNCEDPDCQAHAQCAAYARAPIRAPSPGPSRRDARMPGGSRDAGLAEPPDAGAGADEDGGDAPPTAPGDAGSPPCDGACDPDLCDEGVCRDPRAPTGGSFELRILSVEVPDLDASGMCLDPCRDSFLPSFGFCACSPDPYVEVWRERTEGGARIPELLGATESVADERNPSFADQPIAIELMSGDALELVVMDDDLGAAGDGRIYACRPDLSELASGPLGCSARVISFLPRYSISAELRPLP